MSHELFTATVIESHVIQPKPRGVLYLVFPYLRLGHWSESKVKIFTSLEAARRYGDGLVNDVNGTTTAYDVIVIPESKP